MHHELQEMADRIDPALGTFTVLMADRASSPPRRRQQRPWYVQRTMPDGATALVLGAASEQDVVNFLRTYMPESTTPPTSDAVEPISDSG